MVFSHLFKKEKVSLDKNRSRRFNATFSYRKFGVSSFTCLKTLFHIFIIINRFVFKLREDSPYFPLEEDVDSAKSEDSIIHNNIGMKPFGLSDRKFVLEENDEHSIEDIKYDLESIDSE
jgi:hypothetical protein